MIVAFAETQVVAAEAEKDLKISSFMLAQEPLGREFDRQVAEGLHRVYVI